MKKKITGEQHEKLSEELQSLYKKEGDGNYYLDVDESEEIKAEKAKTKEFRANNITLQKRVEEFEKKFKDVDPDEVKALKQKFQDIEDKKLLDEGEIDKWEEGSRDTAGCCFYGPRKGCSRGCSSREYCRIGWNKGDICRGNSSKRGNATV